MGKWGRQYFPFLPSSPRLAALGEKGEGEGDTSSDVKRGLFPPPSREPKYFSQIKKDASEKEMRERDPPSLLLLRRTQSSRLREIEIMNRARPLREIRESNFLSTPPPPAKEKIADLSGERSRLPRCPEWSFFNEEREQQLGGWETAVWAGSPLIYICQTSRGLPLFRRNGAVYATDRLN